MYKDLIEYLAKSLGDNPDEVEVREHAEDNSVQLELCVNQKDLGKVIGRQGKTARAMRTILGAAAAKEGRRASLEIVE
ncbi:MAG: KH domain-containing protein [Deltaproteobacteria bacterium]|nr:KH domain-containing protein [Candidatus Tharpella sp.]